MSKLVVYDGDDPRDPAITLRGQGQHMPDAAWYDMDHATVDMKVITKGFWITPRECLQAEARLKACLGYTCIGNSLSPLLCTLNFETYTSQKRLWPLVEKVTTTTPWMKRRKTDWKSGRYPFYACTVAIRDLRHPGQDPNTRTTHTLSINGLVSKWDDTDAVMNTVSLGRLKSFLNRKLYVTQQEVLDEEEDQFQWQRVFHRKTDTFVIDSDETFLAALEQLQQPNETRIEIELTKKPQELKGPLSLVAQKAALRQAQLKKLKAASKLDDPLPKQA